MIIFVEAIKSRMTPSNVKDTLEQREPASEPSWSVANRLRFVCGYAWAVVATACYTFAFAVAKLLTGDTNVFRYWASRWGRALMFGFGVRVEADIRTTLDCDRSYVFVANHQNMLDIPLLASVLPCSFGFVAKAELERWPFLGMALKMSPSVFVASGDPRRSLASFQKAGREIREGRSVIVFPEGIRTYSPHLVPFKKSAFVLAAEAGVPVVPITIVDAFRLANEEQLGARRGTVRVVIHPPLEVFGRTRSELTPFIERTKAIIESELKEEQVNTGSA
ncbi:MAG: 1-acyl-sn-glycerol-3-phosphate acyltransferase [Rhodothermales bacterium]|nr:1-acyl-sn-glycerol-3-phosphate acyltransferase [Rhodothermales bacterium]